MRILIIGLCAFCIMNAFDGKSRIGVNAFEIANSADPFIVLKKSSKKAKSEDIKIEPSFELQAIFDEKAMINNIWLRVGEVIDGFELINIKQKTVALQRTGQIIVLNLFESGGLDD